MIDISEKINKTKIMNIIQITAELVDETITYLIEKKREEVKQELGYL